MFVKPDLINVFYDNPHETRQAAPNSFLGKEQLPTLQQPPRSMFAKLLQGEA